MEGGVAFIATPNVIDNCLVDIHSENYQERDESHINYKSSHELQHFLADAGFSQITVKGSSPYFPPITEIQTKNRLLRKIHVKIFKKILYRFVGNDIAYSTYLFLVARR